MARLINAHPVLTLLSYAVSRVLPFIMALRLVSAGLVRNRLAYRQGSKELLWWRLMTCTS